MATITLSLSNREDENSRSEILIRFSASKEQRYRVKSGIYVSSKRWTKKNEISIPKIESKERNDLIKLAAKIEKLKKHIFKEFEISDKEDITKSWLEKTIDKFHFPEKYQEGKGSSFFKLFDEFLSKRKVSEARKRSIRVLLRALKRFDFYSQENSKAPLDIDTMNEDTLSAFSDFLEIEHKIKKDYPEIYIAVPETRKPAPRGLNTLNGLFTKLRTFFKWAYDTGKTENDPFKNFTVPEAVYGTPYYITIQERNQLYKYGLPKHLAVQRDIFVFQCLIGCRVGDFMRMKKGSVIEGAIEYIARKTREGHPVTVRVPLNSQAKEIFERYKNKDGEKLLPFISEQKYNVAIKSAFKLAGLIRMVTVMNPTTREEEKKPLNLIASSHLARRSFIGNLYKKVKDPNLICKLSGHKEGSKAFARYRDIDEETKNELVDLLL